MPPVPPQTAEDRVREDVRLLADAHPPSAEPRAGESRDAGAKGRGAAVGPPGLRAGPWARAGVFHSPVHLPRVRDL